MRCRYGNWAAQPEVADILAKFLNSLSNSAWMNINNGYTDSAGNTGTSTVSHGGTCMDAYSHGKRLSDADVLVRLAHLTNRLQQAACSTFLPSSCCMCHMISWGGELDNSTPCPVLAPYCKAAHV